MLSPAVLRLARSDATKLYRTFSMWSRIQDTLDTPSTSYSGPTDVCIIDPRAVLEGKADQVTSVTLRLPAALIPQVSKGINELGDMDDPMDEWIFGKRAEIFQYRLVGVTGTKSGFTSMITKDALDKFKSGGTPKAPVPDWESFRQGLMSGTVRFPSRKHPFLFAGHMVECAEAAVYELTEGAEVVGLLVSSEAATQGGGESD